MIVESAIARIEQAAWLDPIAQRVKDAVTPILGGGAVNDVLTGRWLGHPVHPAVVIAPLTGWFAGTVLDLVGGPESRRAAQRLIGVGTLAAAPAAMAGTADWLTTQAAEERVGIVHASLADGAVVLYGVSWLLRARRRHRAAMATALAGAAFAGATAFLGGHLSFRRGVGVSTVAFRSGPDTWTELELEGVPTHDRPVRGVADGMPFVVVADSPPAGTPASVQVLEARCSHRGGPLHDGEVVDGCIQCPWHGARFDLTSGAVRRGPATAPQPVYETRRSQDVIEVRREEPGSLRRSATG